jgi:alanine racemase
MLWRKPNLRDERTEMTTESNARRDADFAWASTPGAQARLEIDLGALAENWRSLRARVGAAECAAAVKADAYGIGLAQAVPALARAGCATFFVAHLSEALAARAAAPQARVFLLNGLPPNDVLRLRAAGVRPVLGDLRQLAAWREIGGGPCAIQIDTGMNRLGVRWDEAPPPQDDLRGLGVELILSHFVASEEADHPLNATQIERFAQWRAIYPDLPASLANSSGHFLQERPFFALTRPGYALYGGNPTPGSANPMRPVVRLSAPLLSVREASTGEGCGYNATWTARRPSRIATIGIGYADGYPRACGGADGRAGGFALVNGRRAPIVGRVSMDLITLDVTDVPRARPGDVATLIGDGVGVDEVGAWAGTNGYEVLTRLGRRYARVHHDAG